MHHRRSVKRFFVFCCLAVIPAGVWGHHPARDQLGPRTPAQEQAEQLVAKGMEHLHRQDYRQAAMAFQAATQLNPEDAEAYFSWGVALGALGQHQEEIGKYEQAVRYDSTLGEAYVAWALALTQLRREEEAKAKILEALAAAPGALSPLQLGILRSLGLMD